MGWIVTTPSQTRNIIDINNYGNKRTNIDSAILSKIEELQSNNNAGIMDILQEMDDITCDLADMSLNDPDASQGKYLSIIKL